MAAANFRWIGTTPDYNTAGNWDQGYVPNTTDAGDSILFDGTSQVSPTVNMDRTGDAFNGGCIQITTKPTFTGNIGSPGNPLHIEIASTSAVGTSYNFTHRGTGTVYLKGDTGGFMDVVCDAPLQYGGALSMQLDGAIRALYLKSGNVVMVPATTGITHIFVSGSTSLLTIQGSDTGNFAGDIYVSGGHVINARRLLNAGGTIEISGGTVEQTGIFDADDKVVLNGGVFEFKPTNYSANAWAMYALGGHCDFSQSMHAPQLNTLVIGKLATVSGDPYAGVQYSPTGVFIDQREEFP